MHRRLEYHEGSSSKFWEVRVDGAEVTRRWGKIGSDGRSQTKTFASPDEASTYAASQARSKEKKGYLAVTGGESHDTAPAPGHRAETPIRQDSLLVPGHPEIELRYVEESRDLEVVEPDEDATDSEIEEWERAHPRVVGELWVRLGSAPEPMPTDRFFRLVRFYSHDSYDGSYGLAFEELEVYMPGVRHVAQQLGWSGDEREILRRLGEFTGYPAPFGVPAARREWFEWLEEETSETPVTWREEPPTEVRVGEVDVETILAEARAAIAAGADQGERIDAYEAYPTPDDLSGVSTRAADSPNYLRAYELLDRADAVDESGRSHALRGDWYAANEDQWRTVSHQTAECYANAVERSPEDLVFLEKLALAQQRSGRHAKAIKTFNALRRLDKGNPRWLYLRAVSFAEKGSQERAFKEFDKVVAAIPDDPRVYLLALDSLRGQAELATAQTYAERAVELRPSARAYFERAFTTARRFSEPYQAQRAGVSFAEVHRRAVADYTRAIELAEEPHYNWYYDRARSYEKCGEDALAAKDDATREEIRSRDGRDYEASKREWWAWVQGVDGE